MWFFGGEVVVDCWLKAGELMVRIRARKTCHFFRIYFLRDSHFGNSVLKTAHKIGGVDDTTELTVISQFGRSSASTPNPSAPPAAAARASSLGPAEDIGQVFTGFQKYLYLHQAGI
jgi:hypothetical protein